MLRKHYVTSLIQPQRKGQFSMFKNEQRQRTATSFIAGKLNKPCHTKAITTAAVHATGPLW